MYDFWANNMNMITVNGGQDSGSIARYNHVPGGSNVLYMDGHVEFIRYQSGFPLWVPGYGTNALASAMADWITYMGGMGR